MSRELRTHVVWNAIPLVVTSVASLVSIPLYYRFLGVDHYAIWLYIQTLGGAFGFADLGLGVTMGRYIGVALGRGDQNQAASYWITGHLLCSGLIALFSLVFMAVGMIYGPSWFKVSEPLTPLFLQCVAAGAVGIFLGFYSQMWLVLSQVNMRFGFMAQLRVAVAFVQIGGGVLLAWAGCSPLVLINWMNFVLGLQTLMMMWDAKRTCTFPTWQFSQFSMQSAREMAGFGLQTFLLLVIGSFLGNLDRFVVGKFATPLQFTGYSVAANTSGRVSMLGVAVMAPTWSHSNRHVGDGVGAGLARVFDASFSLLLPWMAFVAAWTFAWHEPVLHLWLGPSLSAETTQVFAPLVLACCLGAMTNISTVQLSSLDRQNIILGFQSSGAVILALAMVIGWREAGMVGAAWGVVVYRLTMLAQDFIVMHMTGARGWRAFATWRAIGLQTGAAALCYGAAWLAGATPVVMLIAAVLHGALMTSWLASRFLVAQRAD